MRKTVLGENDRRIVPRWRGFAASLDLAAKGDLRPPAALPDSFLRNEANWKDDPSLWNALDFIAEAIVEARIDLATDAIEQVRRDSRLPLAAEALISSAMGSQIDDELVNTSTVEEESATQIRRSRRRLAENQWDAVEWMDLARSYTTVGQIFKAGRCVGAALKIAPTNRFIVRAASRFYVHSHDAERALWLLGRANVARDPWLMAPQIAISAIVDRASSFARDGINMLKGDFPAADLTELRAALGTLEVSNGKIAHGKRLLRQSLVGANENSVAQVEWLCRSQLGDVIDVSKANPPRLYEAGAWSAFATGQWDEANRLSALWFRDQPFSGNAATVSSYVLTEVVHDYGAAKDMLITALRCNPSHPILLNNMAYACIHLGKLDEAAGYLAQLPHAAGNNNDAAAEATRGLLEFRLGNTENGRAKFGGAIKTLGAFNNKDQAASASINLAFEELRIGSPLALQAVQQTMLLSEGIKAAHVVYRLKELEEAIHDPATRDRFRDNF